MCRVERGTKAGRLGESGRVRERDEGRMEGGWRVAGSGRGLKGEERELGREEMCV